LREFRTVQLFKNCLNKIALLFAHKQSADAKSLMEVLAARQHIAYQSADYNAGITQFDKNMTELCSTLNGEQIPVFLSTVVSNEKDLPPFISDGNGTGSANWYYSAGQLALKKSAYTTAKTDFDKAKELDELRFRAPEAINTVIKKLAGQYPFVHLVDTKKLFEQYSPNGIVGHETVLEHVHPNLFGYAVMSEAFYQAIQQQQLLKGTPDREISFDELRKEMPITRMDSLKGLYQMMMLKTGWPFNQPIPKHFKVDSTIDGTLAAKVALGHLMWTNAMGQLYRYYQKTDNNQAALTVAEAMVLQYPQSQDFYNLAGNLNSVLKNYSQAAFYYKKLFMLSNNPQVAQAVFQLYLKANDPARAMVYLQYTPPQQQPQTKATLTQIINDGALLKSTPQNAQIKQRILTNYKTLGVDTVFNY